MKDRQLNALLTDHYDRMLHPPQPELNLAPVLTQLKSLTNCQKPGRRQKPKPQS